MSRKHHEELLFGHFAGAGETSLPVSARRSVDSDAERIKRLEARAGTGGTSLTLIALAVLASVGAFVFAGVNHHRLNKTNDALNEINNGTRIAEIINLDWLSENRIESGCGINITFQNQTNSLSFELTLESSDDSISFSTCGEDEPLDMTVTAPANALNFTSSDSSIDIAGEYPDYDFTVN